jgi:hypothetical protein
VKILRVHTVTYQYMSDFTGKYVTNIYMHKGKDKAIEEANELHDYWFHHKNDSSDGDADTDGEVEGTENVPCRARAYILKRKH